MTLFHSSGLEGGGIPEFLRREIPEAQTEDLESSFHRHLSPTLGQWLSEDHAAFAPDDQDGEKGTF